jgi:hypothetical protein
VGSSVPLLPVERQLTSGEGKLHLHFIPQPSKGGEKTHLQRALFIFRFLAEERNGEEFTASRMDVKSRNHLPLRKRMVHLSAARVDSQDENFVKRFGWESVSQKTGKLSACGMGEPSSLVDNLLPHFNGT